MVPLASPGVLSLPGISLAPRRTLFLSHLLNGRCWRVVVASVALVAFALQSYLTQTHIHSAAPQSASISIGFLNGKFPLSIAAKRDAHPAPQKNAPARDDSGKCPICQAMGYAGQFITPPAASFILPSQAISIVSFAAIILSTFEAASHNWQGRAPPQI